MKKNNLPIDDLITLQEIKDIWLETGTFMPYPEVLVYFLEQKARIEGWPDEIKALGMDIAQKMQRHDQTGSLRKPDTLGINTELIREYLAFQAEHPADMKHLRPIRIWGDVTNMGGLNIAFTRTDEPLVEDDTSKQGIDRANYFIRILAEAFKKKTLTAAGLETALLYREGGDELGGYLMVDDTTPFTAFETLADAINAEVEGISERLSLSTIAHRKDPTNPARMGIGFVCTCAEVDFQNHPALQMTLEHSVSEKKNAIAATRMHKHGIAMVRRVPEEKLKDIGALFEIVAKEYEVTTQKKQNPPLTCDTFLVRNHLIPALARQSFAAERLAHHGATAALCDFFKRLLDKYSGNNEDQAYSVDDLHESLIWAATKKGHAVYLAIGQQTNFIGINQKLGHEYCDALFSRLKKEVMAIILLEQKSGILAQEAGVFDFEVNGITTKNAIAIILEPPSIGYIQTLINKIDARVQEVIREEGLSDLPEPLSTRSGVRFVFGAQVIPRDMWNENEIDSFKSAVKEQVADNKAANQIFDLKRAFGDAAKRQPPGASFIGLRKVGRGRDHPSCRKPP